MKIVLIVIAMFITHPALSACPSSVAWAKGFYTGHYSFYAGEPTSEVIALSTPQFAELLRREFRYAHGGVGHLDYDPWLGAQDGEIEDQPVFRAEAESTNAALVSISYPFVLTRNKPREPHVVHLALQKEGGCWLLHDFVTPLGESISHAYSQP